MDAETVRRMSDDFWVYVEHLPVATAAGVKPLGQILAPFQRAWIEAAAPSVMALARGERPPCSRFWCEMVKGSGKDWMLAIIIVWLLAFTRRPLTIQIGAADSDQADETRKSIKAIVFCARWLSEVVNVQRDAVIGLRMDAQGKPFEHSRCDILSADVAGSHGARPDLLVLNELTHVPDGKREYAENLMDNAVKVPNGIVIIATNSGITNTWQAAWKTTAVESPRWHVTEQKEPPPWQDAAEHAEAKLRNTVKRYLRLFKGIWVSAAGDALDPADIEACVTMAGPLQGPGDPRPDPGFRDFTFVGGLDLGVKHDHSGFVILGAKAQRLRLADCQSWSPAGGGQVDLMAVESAVLAAHRRFHLSACYYDPSQALLMAQRLSSAGVPMREMPFVGAKLNEMATSLLTVFRSRSIDLYRHEKLLADISRLTIVEKSYGHKLEAVKDEHGHADTAIALAIALPAAIEASRNWSGQPIYIDSLFLPGNNCLGYRRY